MRFLVISLIFTCMFFGYLNTFESVIFISEDIELLFCLNL